MIKNKFKNLCLLSASLRGGFLVVLFFLALWFTLPQGASAYDVVPLSFDGTNLTVPTYTGDQVLMCQTYNAPATLNYNNNDLSKKLDLQTIGSRFGNIWTLANPTIGTNAFTGTSGGQVQCFLISGVNVNNPILDYSYVSGHQSFSLSITKATTTADNLIMDFYIRYHDWGCSWADKGFTGSQLPLTNYACYNNSRYKYGIATATGDTFLNVTTNNDNTYEYYTVLEFNPAIAGLSITEQKYNPVTGNVLLSGTCVQQGSGIQQLSLYAYELGTSTPDILNRLYPERSSRPSCIDGQWTGLFKGGIIPANDNYTGIDLPALTGANRLVIDDTFFGTMIATVDQTWQDVTGYIRFNYGDLSTVNIDTSYTGGATTTLNFIYNICDDPDYSATSSKIWVVNQTGDNFENTSFGEEDFYQATTCAGVGYITFHLDQGQAGTVRAYYAYANSYGVQYLKSGLFYLVANYNIQQCNPPSYDVSNICEGMDTSGTLGYVQCSIKYAIVASAQFLLYPSCSSLNDITSNYNKFKHSFPFNTYFDLTDSIDSAITSSLTSTTTANNISIPFIRQTATSSEYYMLPVISSTTITNTIGVNNYNTLRNSFGFIWWLLCAVIVFLIVTKI